MSRHYQRPIHLLQKIQAIDSNLPAWLSSFWLSSHFMRILLIQIPEWSSKGPLWDILPCIYRQISSLFEWDGVQSMLGLRAFHKGTCFNIWSCGQRSLSIGENFKHLCYKRWWRNCFCPLILDETSPRRGSKEKFVWQHSQLEWYPQRHPICKGFRSRFHGLPIESHQPWN